MRSKGPTPNTNRTIFAVLGVVIFSSLEEKLVEASFFLDFLPGIFKIDFKI